VTTKQSTLMQWTIEFHLLCRKGLSTPD